MPHKAQKHICYNFGLAINAANATKHRQVESQQTQRAILEEELHDENIVDFS